MIKPPPMNQTSLNIFTDGGARGNPGPAAVGIVIKNSKGKTLHQFSQTIGKTTNNQAEYQAVIAALEWLVKNPLNLKPAKLNFHLDSTLVVNQLNGTWKVKHADLRHRVIQVRQLEGTIKTPIIYTAIPREKNTLADALLNQALDQA